MTIWTGIQGKHLELIFQLTFSRNIASIKLGLKQLKGSEVHESASHFRQFSNYSGKRGVNRMSNPVIGNCFVQAWMLELCMKYVKQRRFQKHLKTISLTSGYRQHSDNSLATRQVADKNMDRLSDSVFENSSHAPPTPLFQVSIVWRCKRRLNPGIRVQSER